MALHTATLDAGSGPHTIRVERVSGDASIGPISIVSGSAQTYTEIRPDVAAISDAVTAVLTALATLADSGAATDAVTSTVQRLEQLGDTAAIVNAIVDAVQRLEVRPDTVTVADALTAAAIRLEVLADSASAADTEYDVKLPSSPVITSPTADQAITGPFVLSGTDLHIGATITVRLDGVVIGTPVVQGDGTWTLNVDPGA